MRRFSKATEEIAQIKISLWKIVRSGRKEEKKNVENYWISMNNSEMEKTQCFRQKSPFSKRYVIFRHVEISPEKQLLDLIENERNQSNSKK